MGWLQYCLGHLEFYIKRFPCSFEEPSVKASKVISIGFFYVILDNTHRVSQKKSIERIFWIVIFY